jgi:hypothetical protein
MRLITLFLQNKNNTHKYSAGKKMKMNILSGFFLLLFSLFNFSIFEIIVVNISGSQVALTNKKKRNDINSFTSISLFSFGTKKSSFFQFHHLLA